MKAIAAIGITVVAGVAAIAAAQSISTVRVESPGGKYKYYRIENRGVRLSRQLSDARCYLNRSWGYDNKGIWVDLGCRAEFRVTKPGGGNGGWSPVPGDGWGDGGYSHFVTVESKDMKFNKRYVGYGHRIEIYRRLSGQRCTKNEDWGYRSGHIWVDNGCRATFRVE